MLMILATTVMLALTLALFPFAIKIYVKVDFSNSNCKLSVKVGFVKLLAIHFYIKNGKISYSGTICGEIDTKRSTKHAPKVKIEQIDSKVICKSTVEGIKYLTVASLILGTMHVVLQENGIKSSCKSVVDSFVGVVASIKCKASLLSLLGVKVV